MDDINKEAAHDRIADALYWLRGYAEGVREQSDVYHTVKTMADNLHEVQHFISVNVPDDTSILGNERRTVPENADWGSVLAALDAGKNKTLATAKVIVDRHPDISGRELLRRLTKT